MEITVRGEKRFIPVATVTLQKTEETNPFHCPNCGNMISIIGGKVTQIYPILEPSEQIFVSFQCHSCRSRFSFQEAAQQPIEISYVKVLLNPTQLSQNFYCYLGGKKHGNILEYKRHNYHSLSLHKSSSIPFLSPCADGLCKVQYKFTQLS